LLDIINEIDRIIISASKHIGLNKFSLIANIFKDKSANSGIINTGIITNNPNTKKAIYLPVMLPNLINDGIKTDIVMHADNVPVRHILI